MTRLPKILLALSVATFAAALTDMGGSIAYGLLKPMGAIFFMLFFLVNLLAKEMARYDEEHRLRLGLARPGSVAAPPSRNSNRSSPETGQNSSLTAAHSH